MEETRDVEALENPILDELKQAVEEYFQSKYFADFSKWREEWHRRRSSKNVNDRFRKAFGEDYESLKELVEFPDPETTISEIRRKVKK